MAAGSGAFADRFVSPGGLAAGWCRCARGGGQLFASSGRSSLNKFGRCVIVWSGGA
jgi:hypothetical protein